MNETTDRPQHRMDAVHFEQLLNEIKTLGFRCQERKKTDPSWRPWIVRDQRVMFDDEFEDLVDAVARLNGRTVDEMLSLMVGVWMREPDLWALPSLYIKDPRWVNIPDLVALVEAATRGEGL